MLVILALAPAVYARRAYDSYGGLDEATRQRILHGGGTHKKPHKATHKRHSKSSSTSSAGKDSKTTQTTSTSSERGNTSPVPPRKVIEPKPSPVVPEGESEEPGNGSPGPAEDARNSSKTPEPSSDQTQGDWVRSPRSEPSRTNATTGLSKRRLPEPPTSLKLFDPQKTIRIERTGGDASEESAQ